MQIVEPIIIVQRSTDRIVLLGATEAWLIALEVASPVVIVGGYLNGTCVDQILVLARMLKIVEGLGSRKRLRRI